MGAYLSEPVTEKHSSEDSSDTLVVGASSMQGWRVNQEDAHNTILSFDKGIQLFAVYDGHGGADVATYCSQKLPDFIRQCGAYSKGDLEEALKQAFLDLDASLTKEEVVAELRKIALSKDSDEEQEGKNCPFSYLGPGIGPDHVDCLWNLCRCPSGPSKCVTRTEALTVLNAEDDEDDDENVANLREEASMPLEDVMAKYQSGAGAPVFKKLQATLGKSPMSPCIRRGGASGSGCSSSTDSTGPSSSGAGPSGSSAGSSSSAVKAENAACSSSGSPSKTGSSSNLAVSSSEENKVDASASEQESKPVQEEKENKPVKEENEEKNLTETDWVSSDTTVSKPESIPKEISNGPSEEKNSKPQVNGDVPHTKEESAENADAVSSTTETSLKNGKHSENDEVTPKGKGKAKDKTKSIVSKDDEEQNKIVRTRKTPIRRVMRIMSRPIELSDSEESDDEDDTSFEESSDDEADNEEEEEDDEEDDDFDTDSDDEGEVVTMDDLNQEPGYDSGCTAVVALLRGRDLFVANAGDSRCVVCRNGKAIDMSLDHKPEDAPERARISAAGGKVTCDGRVNGGLNLSRAIGDHAYKQVKDIPATDQMITALPDVRTLRIDPNQDDFMVLACDGIWNFMSSQDVVDFVRTRLVEEKLKPATICEQLFDHCLSPNTMGDGTGCDNMTAVIIQFKPSLEKEPSTLERETILESPMNNETLKKGDVDDVEMEKEEEEDCDDDETKEEEEEELEEKNENVAKKRVVESDDSEVVVSQKQKKLKLDNEGSEANGVEV